MSSCVLVRINDLILTIKLTDYETEFDNISTNIFYICRKALLLDRRETFIIQVDMNSTYKSHFTLINFSILYYIKKTWACANYTVKNERLALIPFISKQFKEPISRRKSICGRKYHICHVLKCDVLTFFLINLSDYVNKQKFGKRCNKMMKFLQKICWTK